MNAPLPPTFRTASPTVQGTTGPSICLRNKACLWEEEEEEEGDMVLKTESCPCFLCLCCSCNQVAISRRVKKAKMIILPNNCNGAWLEGTTEKEDENQMEAADGYVEKQQRYDEKHTERCRNRDHNNVVREKCAREMWIFSRCEKLQNMDGGRSRQQQRICYVPITV